MKKRLALLTTLCALMFSGVVLSHTGEKLVPVHLIVAQWAGAYQSDNIEDMDALLSENFTGSKQAYLARLPYLPVKSVILRYANYQITGDHARVSSIVHIPYREIYVPFSLNMELRLEQDKWKIISITETDELPEELATINHSHLHVLQDVNVSIRDQTSGEPIYARVHIRDAAGDYWPPQGHRKIIAEGWREDIGGDVVVAGKTFAYVEPNFVLPLPVGKYVMEINRGLEYEPETLELEVTEGENTDLKIELQRWTHMAKQGWYSGDTHTHFLDPQTAMLEARGEDLNVINVLASSGGNLIAYVKHFTGGPSVFSDDENIAYITEETRHDYLGHTVLLNLKKLIYPLGWGGPHTGVHGGYDYPTMAHQADKAHEQGGLVAWSHLPHPHAELPIDVALNKIDAVEAMVFGNPMEKHPVRVRMGDLTPTSLSPLDLWYSLLNTGFDMPALGSTDKMWNSQISGSVRTYVNVEGDFTYQTWIDGIKAGRTFFSSGPMLLLSVDGHEVGDKISIDREKQVTFEAKVESRLPVDRIEIVSNGDVVAVMENPNSKQNFTFKGTLDIDDSAWIAARAYSSTILPTQAHLTGSGSPVMAHTSPVYFEVGGMPRTSAESAAYLIKICDQTIQWAKTKGKYHDENQRKEVVKMYEEARAIYAKQLAPI